MKNENIKEMVREKYSAIAEQSKETNETSCCGGTGCGTYTIMSDDYTSVEGYAPDADLGLGCGIPTGTARIKEGDTVVDLGSGAGNDCFVARSLTGEKGEVIGIDMTETMIEKARLNAVKLGYTNVTFRLGDIEDIPLSSNRSDVVISNCVMNLVPDKRKAFSEVYRILKINGHFSISDIVIDGELPPEMKEAAELYAGCVAGAISREEYLKVIKESGFENIRVLKEKPVLIPDEILHAYLSNDQLVEFRKSGTGITSITVYGEKPEPSCGCTPGSCC